MTVNFLVTLTQSRGTAIHDVSRDCERITLASPQESVKTVQS
ncbi:MAG: hypothetical protein Q4Q37_03055 [Methanobrevibacter sp.]|nr:hypothetical protein [Methanobrevibacter sp.]